MSVNCKWEPQAGSVLVFSSCHLELPVGVEGPSHCHPLGQGSILQDPFCACSISEMGGHPSWWRRQQSQGLRGNWASSWENEHLVPPPAPGECFLTSSLSQAGISLC